MVSTRPLLVLGMWYGTYSLSQCPRPCPRPRPCPFFVDGRGTRFRVRVRLHHSGWTRPGLLSLQATPPGQFEYQVHSAIFWCFHICTPEIQDPALGLQGQYNLDFLTTRLNIQTPYVEFYP